MRMEQVNPCKMEPSCSFKDNVQVKVCLVCKLQVLIYKKKHVQCFCLFLFVIMNSSNVKLWFFPCGINFSGQSVIQYYYYPCSSRLLKAFLKHPQLIWHKGQGKWFRETQNYFSIFQFCFLFATYKLQFPRREL